MKKVQKALTEPGVLKSFPCDGDRWKHDIFYGEELKEVAASWMGRWGWKKNTSKGFPQRL
jgi:hypothetical protein